VACSANGLNVTLAIDYPESLVGGISAFKPRVHYLGTPLSIEGSGNVLSVRQRVTSLLPAGYTLQVTAAPFGDHDSNGDTVDDRLEVRALATIGNSVRPGNVFRTRFDCAQGAGTVVSPSALGCSQVEVGALDGNPMDPALVALIHCSVSLAPAP
jgi:hypothetical protein